MVWTYIVLVLSVVALYSEAKPDIVTSYLFQDLSCIVGCRVTDMPANSEVLLSKTSSEDNSVYFFSDGRPEYNFMHHESKTLTSVLVWLGPDCMEWEGEYMCTVREKTTNPSTWTNEPVYINYTRTPKITGYKYDSNLTLDSLLNGTDVQVECIATGIPKPNITWIKEGDPQFLSVGPMLIIPSMTQAENGIYSCIAENSVGRAKGVRESIEVTKYKPTMKYDSVPIQTYSENQILNDMLDGKMKVLVQGCPYPTVTWWKESGNGRTEITMENNSIEHAITIHRGMELYCLTDTFGYDEHSLKMRSLRKVDLGTYVVKAESSLGIVELKFVIKLDTE